MRVDSGWKVSSSSRPTRSTAGGLCGVCEAAVQCKPGQAELFGCKALVVICEPQGFLDDTVFDFAERVLAHLHLDTDHLTVSMCHGHGRLFGLIAQFPRQTTCRQRPSRAKNRRPFDDVLQLADVAGKVIALQ